MFEILKELCVVFQTAILQCPCESFGIPHRVGPNVFSSTIVAYFIEYILYKYSYKTYRIIFNIVLFVYLINMKTCKELIRHDGLGIHSINKLGMCIRVHHTPLLFTISPTFFASEVHPK